ERAASQGLDQRAHRAASWIVVWIAIFAGAPRSAGPVRRSGSDRYAVGDERGAVVGDQPRRFADAEPGGLVLHDPGAEHGMLPVEVGQRDELLVDESLRAVIAGRAGHAVGRHDAYRRALPAQQRFADVGGHVPWT